MVPSRHEATNIPELVDRVARHLDAEAISWQLLFVDDSDDDTPDAIRAAAAAGHPVRLHHRPAADRVGGLSGALAEGLALADTPVVAVIDADLQHPPEILGAMVGPLVAGTADLAAGSRYLPEGDAEGLDGRWRRFVSLASRRLALIMFPEIRQATDPGSGLFALRREVIDGVELRPEGFKMLVEVLVRGRWTRLHEVPYGFAGRLYGATKTRPIEGVRCLRHFGRLWWDTRVRHRVPREQPVIDLTESRPPARPDTPADPVDQRA